MKAFHNKQSVKRKYVARIVAHAKADELIRGEGWIEAEQKGCAVGCTLNNYNHAQYEVELGIPEWLAHVEDRLYEGMPLKRSKTWPIEFLKAIHVGADLEKVKAPFMIFVLESTLTTFDNARFPNVKVAIDTVIGLYKKTDATDEEFRDAADAAANAARGAYAAADAARAAADAAYAAVDAVDAAYAAVDAVDAAANAARGAYAAARQATYEKFADKLLELIKGCKPTPTKRKGKK